MRIATSLKGLFWTPPAGGPVQPPGPSGTASGDPDDGEANDDANDEANDDANDELAAEPVVARGRTRATPSPAGASPADAPLPDVDFASIYAQTNTAGDPKVDQVLTAFEAMKSAMPAPQLAVAVAATAKAIGADPAAIVATLAQRLSALDTTMADEQTNAAERESSRNVELETLTQKVHSEIDAMEHKCAAFRQQLAAATERVHHKTAAERDVIAAFAGKARGEAERLKALRDFLAKK